MAATFRAAILLIEMLFIKIPENNHDEPAGSIIMR